MIHFVSRARHGKTLGVYLENRGRPLRSGVRLVSWDRVFRARTLPTGTWIFSDLERLSQAETEAAARVWEALAASGERVRLLNHPTRARMRYELLRLLHEESLNDFGVWRASEWRWPDRYPVFVRDVDEHFGALTPLLHDRRELEAALDALDARGRSREALLVVGFRDSQDRDGIYRKYAAFYVAGRVVARHVLFSKDWNVKWPVLLEQPLLEEERRYVETGPHDDAVRGIFERARIDYGRIDYGWVDGRIQVWEINTNPQICTPADEGGPRDAVHARFAAGFHAVLGEIDVEPSRPRVRLPRREIRRRLERRPMA